MRYIIWAIVAGLCLAILWPVIKNLVGSVFAVSKGIDEEIGRNDKPEQTKYKTDDGEGKTDVPEFAKKKDEAKEVTPSEPED